MRSIELQPAPAAPQIEAFYVQTAFSNHRLGIFQQTYIEKKDGLIMEHAPGMGVRIRKGAFGCVVPYENIKTVNETY